MQRNHGLDFLKVICSFMVICIHAPFPGLLGYVITPLTRIAVPLFFMITGFYYSRTKERNNEKKQLLKILRLYIGANCLFFLWSVITTFILNEDITAYMRDAFSVQSMLKFVLLNNSPFSAHLWYLSAILYVLIIVYVFEKKWNRQKLYSLIPFLLLADLVFGKYSLVLLGQEIPNIYVRNFLCVGLPYFLIGDMLYAKNIRIKPKKALFFIIVFISTTLFERFLLGAFHVNAERDHYISTTFLAVFVFLLAIQYESKSNNKLYGKLCNIGAQLSSSIYVLHPIFLAIFAKINSYLSAYLQISSNIYRYIAPLVIFLITTLVSWWLYCLTNKHKVKLRGRKGQNI